MRVADAADRFLQFASAAGLDPKNAPTAQLVTLMLDWYATERAEDVDIVADGDMLLFQWGTYDWGHGPSFQYDITRQFIDANDPDDDGAIWQLSVTAHFPDTLGTGGGSGNQWCNSPDGMADFRAFIEGCHATRLVSGQPPSYIEVNYEQAG